ncbi:MAG TPA: ABC transporter ATP-binding protein [Petrotogaceae bacterium]|nr:ABC transporter ATP-binding protein [Petrotogaceae bacterium]
MNQAIEINLLNKFYDNFHVLKDISLSIQENRIYGLIGRNGAGKTTLMKTIAGQIYYKSGYIKIFGQNIRKDETAVNKICLARETLGAYYEQNTSIKVSKIFEIAGTLFKNWDEQYARHLVKRLGLDTKKYYNKISKGMKTTVGIIIGLASRAEITMFDEPYIGLDPVARDIFFEELNKDYMDNPRTMIISSHLIKEFETLFENIIMIDKGRILIDDTLESIEQKYFYLSGKESSIEKVLDGLKILSKEKIGGLASYAVTGKLNELDYDKLSKYDIQVSKMDIQKILVNLTKEDEADE